MDTTKKKASSQFVACFATITMELNDGITKNEAVKICRNEQF
jgi:hypothetical protein